MEASNPIEYDQVVAVGICEVSVCDMDTTKSSLNVIMLTKTKHWINMLNGTVSNLETVELDDAGKLCKRRLWWSNKEAGAETALNKMAEIRNLLARG